MHVVTNHKTNNVKLEHRINVTTSVLTLKVRASILSIQRVLKQSGKKFTPYRCARMSAAKEEVQELTRKLLKPAGDTLSDFIRRSPRSARIKSPLSGMSDIGDLLEIRRKNRQVFPPQSNSPRSTYKIARCFAGFRRFPFYFSIYCCCCCCLLFSFFCCFFSFFFFHFFFVCEGCGPRRNLTRKCGRGIENSRVQR